MNYKFNSLYYTNKIYLYSIDRYYMAIDLYHRLFNRNRYRNACDCFFIILMILDLHKYFTHFKFKIIKIIKYKIIIKQIIYQSLAAIRSTLRMKSCRDKKTSCFLVSRRCIHLDKNTRKVKLIIANR